VKKGPGWVLRIIQAVKAMRGSRIKADFEGCHDFADHSCVTGWARNVTRPSRPVAVDILIDGTLLATVKADQVRLDFLDTGKGDGRHAFTFPLDLRDGTACGCGRERRTRGRRALEPNWHSIHVRVAETEAYLTGTPKEIICPCRACAPQTSYAVCGAQRSGSSLLCEGLKRTALAGRPEEYFIPWESDAPDDLPNRASDVFGPSPDWSKSHGVERPTPKEFVQLVLREGSTPNGVFGMKLMWNYFLTIVRLLHGLPECDALEPPALLARVFPNLHYVWILRKDKVRQAVSWAIAEQTGVFAERQGDSRPPRESWLKNARFNFEQIDHLHTQVLQGEAGWRAHFDLAGVEPLTVFYEDLVDDFEGNVLRVLDYLGIEYATPFAFGEIELLRQSTPLNDQWAERYIETKGQRQ